MKIVLCAPRGYPARQQGRDIHALACIMPPMGLASLAAMARRQGHRVRIVDAALLPWCDNREIARRILAQKPDLCGLSAVTATFEDACEICTEIKRGSDTVYTVIGGPHVSWGGAPLLRRVSNVDAFITGEGELALCDLADGRSMAEIEGLVYRDGDTVKSGPERTTLCRMDELPFPAYDLLEGFPRQYRMPLFGYPRGPGASVISSRGCVYRCSYCDRSVFKRGFRFNSPEYTAGQVAGLARDFGVRHVTFYDDLFTLHRERVARLCALLMKQRPRIRFNCIVRLGHIDEELVRLLRRSGCWMVHVGIESGDSAILAAHKDGLDLATIHRDVALLHREGLWIKGLFMIGFPGETMESIAATRELACSLPLKDINVTAFTPFPGAPVYPTIREQGTFFEEWSHMDCEHVVFVPRGFESAEVLQQERQRFITAFYRRPAMRAIYLKMLWQSPHSYLRLLRHAGHFLAYARELKSPGARTP